jgi:uncharacterized protein YciI
VPRIFAVIRSRGPGWNAALGMEEQEGWRAHADFMDALYAEGFFLLAGPLEGTSEVLLIVRAESESAVLDRLARDPWSGRMLSISRVAPWTLRLGFLD